VIPVSVGKRRQFVVEAVEIRVIHRMLTLEDLLVSIA